MNFSRIYSVACACCKSDGADVPEVEAAIRLLLPALQSAYARTLDAISGRAAELLRRDGIGPEELAVLLAAYVTASRRLAARPLSPGAVKAIEQTAASLAESAALASSLPIPASLSGSATLAAERLQLLVEDLIERAVDQSLPAASRLAQAGLTGPGASASTEVFRAELEDALDVERAIQPLLDAWAYQTYNAGSVRAAAADGHNFIQLSARIDAVTTAFCRLVDGRVVPMARALAQLDLIEQAVAAGDVAALRSAAPFHPNPDQATQQDVDAALERGGLAPFHFSCRTRNVPIRLPSA